jgi:hypothetical protein
MSCDTSCFVCELIDAHIAGAALLLCLAVPAKANRPELLQLGDANICI